MGAHFVGTKKLLQLSKKFQITIIAGISLSGTKKYEVLTDAGETLLIDVKDLSITPVNSENKPSLRREANISKANGKDQAR